MKTNITIYLIMLTCFSTILQAQPVMVSDIYPGSLGASPTYFTSHANKLYFVTRDSVNNNGSSYLYESDGTSAGTKQLLHLGNAKYFKTFGNQILYTDDSTGGTNWEPWITDGTTAGTIRLKDINPGNLGSGTVFLGDIAQTAFMFSPGYGIYKTNGTAAGTTLLFNTTALYKSIIFNNKMYYWGTYNLVKGLWSFDASSTQPTLMAEHTNSVYDFAIAVGSNNFYYVATDSAHGYEPWVSDGTAAGTHILKDIRVGPTSSCDDGSSSSYSSFAILNNKLYFNPTDDTHGRELWVSDGTLAGTNLFMELTVGISSGNPKHLIVVDNKLFFAARYPSYNTDFVWVCDETVAGTNIITDINGSYIEDGGKYAVGNKLFINGRSRSNQVLGFEPFISDGTSNGTYMLADIDSINSYSESISSGFNQLPFTIGNTIYFVADDGVHGNELWKYTSNVTTAIKEIKELSDIVIYPNPVSNELHISSQEKISQTEIYDIKGSLQIKSANNTIDVSALSSGIYFIRIFSNNGVATRKLFKQ